jgi:hypothetical protein
LISNTDVYIVEEAEEVFDKREKTFCREVMSILRRIVCCKKEEDTLIGG